MNPVQRQEIYRKCCFLALKLKKTNEHIKLHCMFVDEGCFVCPLFVG